MDLKIQWRFNGYFSMEISWKQFMFGDMKMHYFFLKSKYDKDIISGIYLI
jgi:hypothetical protein